MRNGNESSGNDELVFYQLCAMHQQVNVSVAPRLIRIYDNRIDQVPEQAAASFAPRDHELRQSWFVNYLRKKFIFLKLVLMGEDDEQSINAALGAKAGDLLWEQILTIWRTEAPRERLAYLYRISQHDPDVVHLEWYNQLPEFDNWARLCREQLGYEWNAFISQPFMNSYSDLLETLRKSGNALNFEDAYVLEKSHSSVIKALELKTSGIYSHLAGLDSTRDVFDVLENYFHEALETETPYTPSLSPSMQVADALTHRFLTMLESGETDPDRYLSQFGKEMTNVFQCRVCDYLVVVGNGDKIRIHSTSFDISEQNLRRRLDETEFYDRGEGITGSILINPQPRKRFHVGTNNLAEDARQSPWHDTAYKEIYGPTYNFWVFPLFVGGRIDAAFRVINRQVDGYWPYYVRLQLLETAQWFEKFWRVIRHFLGKLKISSLLPSTGHTRAAEQLRKTLGVSWIEKDFLEETLAHLCTVVHRKVEDKRVGCCIGIVETEEMEILIPTLGSYITVDASKIRTLDDASDYYSRVIPTAGMFAFSKDGVFQAVLELQTSDGKRGENGILSISDRYNCVILLVQKGREAIQIYHSGTLAAEYYLSHGSGSWKLRYYSQTLDAIRNAVPWITRRVLERVYAEAWRLSYLEIGAMIVVMKDRLPEAVSTSKGSPVGQSLDKLSEQEFEDLARMDGAILISSRGIVDRGGAMLNLDRDVVLSHEIETMIDGAQKGNRHRTAARLSSAASEDVLVFTVSKNRGISVFYGGEHLVWDL